MQYFGQETHSTMLELDDKEFELKMKNREADYSRRKLNERTRQLADAKAEIAKLEEALQKILFCSSAPACHAIVTQTLKEVIGLSC